MTVPDIQPASASLPIAAFQPQAGSNKNVPSALAGFSSLFANLLDSLPEPVKGEHRGDAEPKKNPKANQDDQKPAERPLLVFECYTPAPPMPTKAPLTLAPTLPDQGKQSEAVAPAPIENVVEPKPDQKLVVEPPVAFSVHMRSEVSTPAPAKPIIKGASPASAKLPEPSPKQAELAKPVKAPAAISRPVEKHEPHAKQEEHQEQAQQEQKPPETPQAAIRPLAGQSPAAISGQERTAMRKETAKPEVSGIAEVKVPSKTATPQLVRDIAIRVETKDAAPVGIRLSERGGEIHVSVRTTGTETAHDLRGDLGSLVGNLKKAGFDAEAWTPGSVTHGVRDTAKPTNDQGPGDTPGGSQQHGREQQEQPPRQASAQEDKRRRPDWQAAFENSLETFGTGMEKA